MRFGSCSLGNLERQVLGCSAPPMTCPRADPDIYRQYYLTGGGTEMLARVFYHNLGDIVSMVLLAAHGPQL